MAVYNITHLLYLTNTNVSILYDIIEIEYTYRLGNRYYIRIVLLLPLFSRMKIVSDFCLYTTKSVFIEFCRKRIDKFRNGFRIHLKIDLIILYPIVDNTFWV